MPLRKVHLIKLHLKNLENRRDKVCNIVRITVEDRNDVGSPLIHVLVIVFIKNIDFYLVFIIIFLEPRRENYNYIQP